MGVWVGEATKDGASVVLADGLGGGVVLHRGGSGCGEGCRGRDGDGAADGGFKDIRVWGVMFVEGSCDGGLQGGCPVSEGEAEACKEEVEGCLDRSVGLEDFGGEGV